MLIYLYFFIIIADPDDEIEGPAVIFTNKYLNLIIF